MVRIAGESFPSDESNFSGKVLQHAAVNCCLLSLARDRL